MITMKKQGRKGRNWKKKKEGRNQKKMKEDNDLGLMIKEQTCLVGLPDEVPMASTAVTTSNPSATSPNTTWRPEKGGVLTRAS